MGAAIASSSANPNNHKSKPKKRQRKLKSQGNRIEEFGEEVERDEKFDDEEEEDDLLADPPPVKRGRKKGWSERPKWLRGHGDTRSSEVFFVHFA